MFNKYRNMKSLVSNLNLQGSEGHILYDSKQKFNVISEVIIKICILDYIS